MMKLRHLNTRQFLQWFQSEPEQETPARASTGQVLVMFALFLTGLISMLGMATDLGYAFSQRRSSQNAADAAALAGARKVVKQESAWSDANSAATANQMNNTTITMSSCTYVRQNTDGSITNLGANCGIAPPANANGVRAEVTETHNTFFMRALPGTMFDTVTVTTDATASVQLLLNVPGEGPFLVCGNGLNGQQEDLVVKVGGVWQLNPLADKQVYNIHDSSVEDCDAQSNSFKGVFLRNASSGNAVPGWWNGDTGNQAGPVNQAVNGPQGCNAGATGNFSCVMLLPIGVNEPDAVKVGTDGYEFYVVAMGAFFVESTGSNSHSGKFLYDYSIRGAGDPGSWSPGSTTMPITIRLIE